MPEIPDVGVNKISTVQVHSWTVIPPVVTAIEVPVTVDIGTPIVLMPGCVESHPLSNRSNSIQNDDPRGVKTYCDANAPSFTPLDYNPEELIFTKQESVPTYKAPRPELKDIPKIPSTKSKADTSSSQTKEVTEPKAEETPTEVVTPVQAELTPKLSDFLPSPQQVTTTASIAVVATSAALLAKPFADFLLKLIKPAVKKTQKRVFDALGKEIKVQSVRERVIAQRERNRAVLALRRSLKK